MQKEVRFEDSFLAEYYPGGFKQIERESRRRDRSIKWARGHLQELARDYPESFVALHMARVVAHSRDVDEVLDQVEQLPIERREVFIHSTHRRDGYEIL